MPMEALIDYYRPTYSEPYWIPDILPKWERRPTQIMKDRFPSQVVILAGGRGTRLVEKTRDIPKPMLKVGDKTLLEWIIDIYSVQGLHEFIIPVGYRKEVIFQYFMEKFEYTYEMDNENKVLIGKYGNENLTIVDTGDDTLTGGRIKRIKDYVDGPFFCTYGDGLAPINLAALSNQHRNSDAIVTLTAVHPPPRFGSVKFTGDDGQIEEFGEKQDNVGGWVNGGYMLCEPSIFQEIGGDDTNFEYDVLPLLAYNKELFGYKHNGWWRGVDTLRDLIELNDMVEEGNIEWMKIFGQPGVS